MIIMIICQWFVVIPVQNMIDFYLKCLMMSFHQFSLYLFRNPVCQATTAQHSNTHTQMHTMLLLGFVIHFIAFQNVINEWFSIYFAYHDIHNHNTTSYIHVQCTMDQSTQYANKQKYDVQMSNAIQFYRQSIDYLQ